jgi:hypothetical protein
MPLMDERYIDPFTAENPFLQSDMPYTVPRCKKYSSISDFLLVLRFAALEHSKLTLEGNIVSSPFL